MKELVKELEERATREPAAVVAIDAEGTHTLEAMMRAGGAGGGRGGWRRDGRRRSAGGRWGGGVGVGVAAGSPGLAKGVVQGEAARRCGSGGTIDAVGLAAGDAVEARVHMSSSAAFC